MIWLTLFFLSTPLITLVSDQARYHGREVELDGAVGIEHAGSRITAHSARICGKEESKESIEEIELHGDVVIELPKGGTLECDHAFLHADSFQGRFAGKPVRYREKRQGEWLSLECERMDIEATPAEEVKNASLQRIAASGSVVLSQGERMSATADRAIYLTQDKSQRVENGMMPTDPSWWQASLTDAGGPGHLLVRIIDRPCEILVLTGNVSVKQGEIGQLTSDGSVYLVRSDGRQIDRITSSGTTMVSFADEEGMARTLTCQGQAVVDQDKRQIRLTSPTETGKQLHYCDQKGELYADAMTIDYLGSTEGLKGSRVVVTGGIRLRNRQGNTEVPLLLGMADRLEYIPDTEMMTLEADPGKRVVFLDETQDARVSARKVFYDRRNQAIEGMGSVRFNLSDHEVVNLRNIFGTE